MNSQELLGLPMGHVAPVLQDSVLKKAIGVRLWQHTQKLGDIKGIQGVWCPLSWGQSKLSVMGGNEGRVKEWR